MTELEWPHCTDPYEILYSPKVAASARQLRLFAAACCRRLRRLGFPIEPEVRILERFADGAADAVALAQVEECGRVKFEEGVASNPGVIHYFVCSALEAAAGQTANPYAATAAAYACAWHATRSVLPNRRPAAAWKAAHEKYCALAECPQCLENRLHARHDSEAESAWRQERHLQCTLLRDILGNPFRPAALDPSWRTPTAVAIARRAYGERDFSALPVLADALEDGGCDDGVVLDHCRGTGPHVRGCWVVDVILSPDR